MQLKPTFLVLVLMALGSCCQAHDLTASHATARLLSAEVEFQIKIAADSAWPLVQEIAPGAVFLRETFETEGKPLLLSFAKTMHEVTLDGKTLSPLRIDVTISEDNFLFTFIYPRPPRGALQFKETYLRKMPAEYSSYLRLCDETGAVLALANLNGSKSTFELPLLPSKSGA
jgi:hypothetical protein